ncbi:MAG: hypothetical protein M3Z24_14370 [Chloroflexota bacterium]|nr:hypothetical protein [Chloroflexota bacterium]
MFDDIAVIFIASVQPASVWTGVDALTCFIFDNFLDQGIYLPVSDYPLWFLPFSIQIISANILMSVSKQCLFYNCLMVVFDYTAFEREPPTNVDGVRKDGFDAILCRLVMSLRCFTAIQAEFKAARINPTLEFGEQVGHLLHLSAKRGQVPIKLEEADE